MILVLLTSSNVFSQPTFERLYGTIDDDIGYSLTRCSQGGYLITGTTMNYYFGDPEIYMVRITEYGDTLWTKTYSHPHYYEQNILVHEHSDNSYLIGSNTAFDTSLVIIQKYNDQGSEFWTKYYSVGDQTFISSLTSSPDGIVFCGGFTPIWPSWASAYVLKTDNDGNELWSQTYAGSNSKQYYTHHIANTLDNSYIVCGAADYPEFEKDNGVLIKLNQTGQTKWMKEYSYPQAGRSFSIFDCKQLTDSSYIALGVTCDVFLYENKRPVLMKTDQNGNFLWFKQLDLLDLTYYSLTIDTGNRFILAGPYNDSAQILITDQAGEIISSVTFESGYNAALNQIIQSNDAGYIMTGSAAVNSGYGGTDAVIIKANQDGVITKMPENKFIDENPGLTVWPNPCTENTEVKCNVPILALSVFDAQGKCIYDHNYASGTKNTLIINTSSFPAGLLLIRCVTSHGIYFKKIIKH